MGIYDRDYMRNRDRPASKFRPPAGGTGWLLALLIVVGALLIGKTVLTNWRQVAIGRQLSEQEADLEREIMKQELPVEFGTPAKLKQLVNINTATREELEAVPYISESGARWIIAHRPFTAFEELCKVPGIKEKKLQLIMPYIEK